MMSPQDGTEIPERSFHMAQNPRTSELQTSCAKMHLGRKYRGAGQVQEVTKEPDSSLCEIPEAQEILQYSVLLPKRDRSPAKPCTYKAGGKHRNHRDRTAQVCLQLFPPRFYSKIKKELPHTNPRQEPGGHTTPQMVRIAHYCSRWQDSGRRAESRDKNPRVRPAQSVVDLRYQNRARKSSLHVIKPGLVGECTMQRTMLLWPRDSRFLRSAVLESQQQRLMVLSSGSKI